MSGLTGYLTNTGVDLSYVFQNGTTQISGGYRLANGNALTFLASTSGNFVSKTGYLGSNGQDLSTIFEPRSISIVNYNFASPSENITPYYHTITGTNNGWTFAGSTAVGYGSASVWNRVSTTSQYAILQQILLYPTLYPEVYQAFALFPMKYKLTFLIIGRNNPPNSYYNATQSCDVYANATKILSFSSIGNTAWNTKSIVFTGSSSTIIKFTTGTTSVDSSYLITNVSIIVA